MGPVAGASQTSSCTVRGIKSLMGLGASQSSATENCTQDRPRFAASQPHQNGAAPNSGGNDAEASHGCEGKVPGVGACATGPARYTISGATQVIRPVMHAAWSKKPPLARQNETDFERIIGAREARIYS